MHARLPAKPQAVTLESDGIELAGRLFRPAGPLAGALLVCHGAGSRKENHEIMGEQAAAAGLAALTFDCRGHGQSGGVLDPDGWHDTVAAGHALMAATEAPWLAARGASMGGCFLLLAAHAHPRLFRSLVLLCPADGASLLAGLDEYQRGAQAEPDEQERGPQAGPAENPCRAGGRPAESVDRPQAATTAAAQDPAATAGGGYSARFAVEELRPFLRRLDLVAAARGLPRVLLAHARDDHQVPFAHTERLAEVLAAPTRFIALKEGGHHGPGRSALIARATLEWAIENGGD